MERTKSLKLQLIQQVLSCDDPAVLAQALQVIQSARAGLSKPTDQALHLALLGEAKGLSLPSSEASGNEEAIADLQQSIDEIFG